MRVIETSLEEDLSLFSRYLWQHQITHRIFEERGRQILEVLGNPDGKVTAAVSAAYAAWREGKLVLQSVPRDTAAMQPGALGDAEPGRAWQRWLLDCPVLALTLLLAIVVFPFALPLAEGEVTAVAGLLTIVDLRTATDSDLGAVLAQGAVWRWVTPVFLHFSVVHLLFNCVVTFELGRRIEMARGSVHFLLIVLLVAAVSNLGQVYWNAYPIFGGLSGVAYGLLGYLLVLQRRWPEDPRWQLPPGFALSLLVFLVIFSTGVTEAFGLNVANPAHWFGLVSGAVLALLPGRVRA